MERLIFKYTVGDEYTYWADEYITFEYESKEAAELDIFKKACETFLNDDMDGWKDTDSFQPKPYDINILGTRLEYYFFFSRKQIPNSKRFKIEYAPKFEILTVDDFFNEKETLFS